jgi:hypothetical protein
MILILGYLIAYITLTFLDIVSYPKQFMQPYYNSI